MNVTYNKGDSTTEDIVELLERVPAMAADLGYLTDDSTATVDVWDSEVEVVKDED